MDNPISCLNCPLCVLSQSDGKHICSKTRANVEAYFDKAIKVRPSWCPLKQSLINIKKGETE